MKSRMLVMILASVVLPGLSRAGDYYLSPAGDDSFPGTQDRPWRTIERANRADFEPGDRLCFQGAERFAGTIRFGPDDSGTSDGRLVVTSYGKGRATIDGANGSGLVAQGCDHLVVTDVNFVGLGRKNGNTADGVVVIDSRGVRIDRIEVRGFRGSGLVLDGVRDAEITHVQARENGFAGISVGYERRSTRVRIAHCLAENNPGDPSNLTNHSGNGIVVANADDATIEYCLAFNNGWDMPREGNGPVGIWVWNVDRAIIQHCISHDNKSPGDDGGGFDVDGGATNSILQYNLSYNNDGPGYFLCQFPGASDFKNNVIRYNVSHNDGVKNNRRSGIDVFSASPNASDCQVYNNTVYNGHGAAVGFGGLPMPNVVFRNNVFICAGDVIAGETGQGTFENNIYWPADGRTLRWAQEGAGSHVDPKIFPVDAGLPTDPASLVEMAAYKLQADSPCLGAGILIENNGGRDFWGNPVPQDNRPAVGACEKP